MDVHFGTIKVRCHGNPSITGTSHIQCTHILNSWALVKIFPCTFPISQAWLIWHCLDCSPNSIPSLLMMAQINLHQGNPKLSMQSLEQALSRHFEAQSYPLYHLVRVRVVMAQENMAHLLQEPIPSLHLPLDLFLSPTSTDP